MHVGVAPASRERQARTGAARAGWGGAAAQRPPPDPARRAGGGGRRQGLRERERAVRESERESARERRTPIGPWEADISIGPIWPTKLSYQDLLRGLSGSGGPGFHQLDSSE